ncbi:MAG: hypothetical protein KC503_08935 [Myxococcales bacterium]|nr:hypothetical protein [Myxococcales bacterium]
MSDEGRWRYAPLVGACAGLLVSLVDIGVASAIGVSFASAGHDVTLWVWLYLALSFGVLGWFIGDLLRRRREARRAAQALVAEQRLVSELSERLAIKEKLASLGQLAASIAHEVKNPLAIMRSAVQNLAEAAEARDDERGADDDEQRGYQMVIEEIDRLSGVVGSLLDLARPPALERHVTDVAKLIERVQLLTRPICERRGVRVERAGDSAAAFVDVDADLLTQVLLGLVDNALQASPAGAMVELEARIDAQRERVELRVSDAGEGVDEALRDKVFEPLYTTRSAEGGHGLGLAVARQIVEAHDGRIEVRDAEPRGACFVVSLPRAASARVTGAAAA